MRAQSDLLSLYVLGALDGDEAEHAAAVLAADPALRAELDAVVGMIGAGLEPVAPAASVRARLLASIGAPARETGLAGRVAALFDLAVDQARAVIGWTDERARWVAMGDGIELATVDAGPAQQGKQCALVRIGPGVRFPWHTHDGEEHAMVLAGGATMSDGRVVAPGDEVIADASVEHDFVAHDDGACVFAVRAEGWRIVPRPAA